MKDSGAEPTDAAVIQQVLTGDINAFEALMERYEGWVFSILARYLPAEQVAEAAQDVFIQAYRGLAGYRGQAPFRHWLARIAVRQGCNYWRRQNRRPVIVSPVVENAGQWLEQVDGPQARAMFAREQDRKAAKEMLQVALGHLSANDRMVLTLLYLDERSVREAADLLGWTSVNVKVRAYRARQALRRIIEKMMGSERSGHATELQTA